MNKYKYLLSIIIPTRNRMYYAKHVCDQILSISDDGLELIIQDNSDSDELYHQLSEYIEKDSRLKYSYTNYVLSSIENFNMAISQANGEYICIIGDDDGVNPDILKIVKWASLNNIPAIKPALRATYTWPKSKINEKFNKDDDGYFCINTDDIDINVTFKSTEGALIKLLNNGCQNYLNLDMLKLYHGIVKKQYMDEIHKITGHYLGGLSPDIYASVALTILVDKILCIDFPLTIPGVCSKSGSADSVTRRHEGELKDAPHLLGHTEYSWADEVPKFYSVETIWADSALAALKEMKKENLIEDFNLSQLIAYCLYKHKNFSNIINDHYNKYCTRKMINPLTAYYKLSMSFIKGPFHDVLIRIFNKIKRNKSNILRFYDVSNISDAVAILSKYLSTKTYSIDIILERLNGI